MCRNSLGCVPKTLATAMVLLFVAAATSFLGARGVVAQGATFSQAGTLRIPRSSFPALVLPDGFVLIGGDLESEMFSPEWGESIGVNVPLTDNYRRSARGVRLADGRFFVSGGHGGPVDATMRTLPTRPLDSTMIFDPSTLRWTAGPRMNEARRLHSATLLMDGKVLITGGSPDPPGGFTVSKALASAEIYDPATNTSTSTVPMTRPHFNHSGVDPV